MEGVGFGGLPGRRKKAHGLGYNKGISITTCNFSLLSIVTFCNFPKRKLENHEYKDPIEAVADIRLVWSNCMAYNQVDFIID